MAKKTVVGEDGKTYKLKEKRPFYKLKRFWLLVIIIIVIVAVNSGSGDDDKTVDPKTGETTAKKGNSYTLGDTFDFDGASGKMRVTVGTDLVFDKVDNQFADENGKEVVGVPITVENIDEETGGLNFMEISAFNTSGTKADIGSYFDDDIIMMDEMRPGAKQDGHVWILYDGDGEYVIEFEKIVGKTTEVKFNVEK